MSSAKAYLGVKYDCSTPSAVLFVLLRRRSGRMFRLDDRRRDNLLYDAISDIRLFRHSLFR